MINGFQGDASASMRICASERGSVRFSFKQTGLVGSFTSRQSVRISLSAANFVVFIETLLYCVLRKTCVYSKTKFGDLGVELGAIWGGQPLNGRRFQFTEGEPGNYGGNETDLA